MNWLLWDSTLTAVIAGYILDLLIGDPHGWYHPVRLVGKLIEIGEKRLRVLFTNTEAEERRAGKMLVVFVCGVTTLAVFLLVHLSSLIHPVLGWIVKTILCYWLFAVRSLKDESMKVYDKLAEDDLEGARYAVSMIVGRDTAQLSAEGVTKAAVETVAENTSDGILAPMIYMMIGGPILGWFYKSVNTMDSMVGYKNDKYMNFGRCAAKFDDVVNFIPARLSGLLMCLSASLCGLDGKNAYRIFKRDRFNHASPNSAQTEAVMAGALHVQLAGDANYFGKIVKKKTIGDADRAVEIKDIPRANRLLYTVSAVSLVVLAIVRVAAVYLIR